MCEPMPVQDEPWDAALRTLPYVTDDLPGIEGELKLRAEDFEVDEIPAYEPSGSGDHLFLWVEKQDVSADQLATHVARCLEVPRRDVGMAGLKDRRAVTRQYVSVPAHAGPLLTRIDTDSIRLLSHRLHGNKLRTGHLKGNRFSILVRDPDVNGMSRAEAIQERLVASGFPNYFGEQRFGWEGTTLKTGFALLRNPSRKRRKPGFVVRLSLSAVQSFLFNLALVERVTERLLGRVLAGDVMKVCATGGPFVVEDVDREQPRFEQRETVVTGPLFGPNMLRAGGEVALREERLLERFGLQIGDFARYRKLSAGTRRAYLSWPEDLSIEPEPDGLRFRFTLPKGVYATSLLREFMKVDGESN